MRTLSLAIALLLVGNPAVGARPELAAPPREKEEERVELRLVAAKISPRRGQKLMVKLVPGKKGKGVAELLLRFRAPSCTPHGGELSRAVRKAVPPLPVGTVKNGWKAATDELVFSVPRELVLGKAWLVDWAKVRLVQPKAKAKK